MLFLDSDKDEIENVDDVVQNRVLCDNANNDNVLSNEIKIKKRKKRNKKPKDTAIKCPKVNEIKELLIQTIKKKDVESLKKYLLLEGLNSSITLDILEISLNEPIDETNNTILHLATINNLHDHIQ